MKRKDFVNGGRKGQKQEDVGRGTDTGGCGKEVFGSLRYGEISMPCTYGISVRIKRTEEQAGKRIRIGAKGSRLSLSNRPGVCYTGQAKDSSRNRVKRVFSGEQEQSEEDRWKERERAESRGMAGLRWVIGGVGAVIVLALVIFLVQRYTPSKERMALTDYFVPDRGRSGGGYRGWNLL